MPNTNKYASLIQLKETYSKTLLIRISNFNEEDDFDDYEDDNLINALQDASDIMDGYLMGRYATPISPAPDYFKPDCMVIAVSKLVERKGYNTDTPDEQLYLAGKDLIKNRYMLIAMGKIELSLPDSGGSSEPVSNVRSYAPTIHFSQDTLDKY